MSTASAGWHPDPSNPAGALRWWDGNAWTAHVQPIQPIQPIQPMAQPGTPGGAGTPGAPAAPAYYPPVAPPLVAAAPRTVVQRNSLSLVAVGVVTVYVLLALVTHFVLLGIFPVLLAFRAVRAKEQLAPLAIVAAVIAIGVALLALA